MGVGAAPYDTHLRAQAPGTETKRGCRGTRRSGRLQRRSVETRRGVRGARHQARGAGRTASARSRSPTHDPGAEAPRTGQASDLPKPLFPPCPPPPREGQLRVAGHTALLTRPGSKEGLFWSPGPQEPEPGRSARPAGRVHVTPPRPEPAPTSCASARQRLGPSAPAPLPPAVARSAWHDFQVYGSETPASCHRRPPARLPEPCPLQPGPDHVGPGRLCQAVFLTRGAGSPGPRQTAMSNQL